MKESHDRTKQQDNTSSTDDVLDVLIVGSGPVGLTAALEATRLGLTTRIIERKLARSTHDSRALVVHPRVLELFTSSNNASQSQSKPSVVEGIQRASFHIRQQNLYLDSDNENDGDERAHPRPTISVNLEKKDDDDDGFVQWGDTDYPFLSFLPQYDTERVLEQCLFDQSGVAVEYGVSLQDLIQQQQPQSLCQVVVVKHEETSTNNDDENNNDKGTITNNSNTEEEIIRCKYVIGCDGGRSPTRALIGATLDRTSDGRLFALADVRLVPTMNNTNNDDKDNNDQTSSVLSVFPDKQLHVFPSKHGIFALLPLPGEYAFRIGFIPPDDMTKEEIQQQLMSSHNKGESFLQDVLLERTGVSSDYVKVQLGKWQSVFEVTHGVADCIRNNNVFLAGDAAHVHSPVGGQGMNYGMQDVFNLMWKLAWVRRLQQYEYDQTNTICTASQAEERKAAINLVLDSYHDERHSIGSQLVQSVERGTSIIMTTNPWLIAIRNFVARWFAPFVAKDMPRKVGQLENKYQSSWSRILVDNPPTTASSFSFFGKDKMSFAITSPGERLPNLTLTDGSKLYQHISRDSHTWVVVNHDDEVDDDSIDDKDKEGSSCRNTVNVTFAIDQSASVPALPNDSWTKPQVILVRPDLFVAGIDQTKEGLLTRMRAQGWNEAMIASM